MVEMWESCYLKKIFNQLPSILLFYNCHIHNPHFHWLRNWIIRESPLQLGGATSHENLHVFHTMVRLPVKFCLRNINPEHDESIE